MVTMTKIVLPWPDRMLSPNTPGHWAKKYRYQADAKNDGYLVAMEETVGDLSYLADGRVLVKTTFYPPDRRRRDEDNAFASLKYYFDGIALAIGIDDYYFVHDRPVWMDPEKPGRVEIELEVFE
jgi:crossover junction endodeoxyribonuclease RusA